MKDVITFTISALIGAIVDIAVFCSIAAIPLAALVVLGILSQGTAAAIVAVVACLTALLSGLNSALQADAYFQ